MPRLEAGGEGGARRTTTVGVGNVTGNHQLSKILLGKGPEGSLGLYADNRKSSFCPPLPFLTLHTNNHNRILIPSGPVVKNLPTSAGDVGSIPG